MTNINGTTYTNGMHNFLNNANFTGSCVAGSYAQESANLSSTYCLSGSSLLPPIPFVGTINPVPSSPLNASAPAGGLIFLNDTNSVFFDTVGPNGTNGMAFAYNGNVTAETWGIGAFKAVTQESTNFSATTTCRMECSAI